MRASAMTTSDTDYAGFLEPKFYRVCITGKEDFLRREDTIKTVYDGSEVREYVNGLQVVWIDK